MPSQKNTTSQTQITKFLDAWRTLEQACTEEKNMTVQQFEQELETAGRQAEASRLRICRQVRNFLVHDSQDFVTPTNAMCAFTAEMAKAARLANGTARDVMTSAAAYGQATMGDDMTKVAMLLLSKKRGDVIIKDRDGSFAGMAGARTFASALAEKKIKAIVPAILDQPPCTVDASAPVSTLPEGRAAVMDGKKCIGIINPRKGWQE